MGIDLKQTLSNDLVAWYNTNARSLPWRETMDPYAIWVSEIMLQQTQVKTVLPYYDRFLKAFPTIEALAMAPEDSVIKLWEGLGYYARCRNMHKAAKKIMAEHGGVFPQVFSEVQALPGIGQSTAGAILTFSFFKTHGLKYPLLDGNVKRVLARLFDVSDSIEEKAVIQQLWQYSQTLLDDATDAWAFNQAIMELGATICVPKDAKCLICPLAHGCQAKANGTQAMRPVVVKRAPTPHHHIGAAVIWRLNAEGEKEVFIQRRPAKGLLGGLWEFPGGKQEPEEHIETTVLREIEEELGFTIALGEKIVAVRHAYTHFRITLHAYWAEWQAGELGEDNPPKAADAWQWVAIEDLTQFAFPKANNKVIEAIQG